MKLDLSRRDYRSLLTVLEIADWVLHAFRTEEPQETAPLRVLEQKVLALAEEFGCGELVEYDAIEQRYWLTRDYDEVSDAVQLIEEFENDSFWDQLSDRLVERDLILETLTHCLGNRTRAAEILGISIRTLRNKLHDYRAQGVPVPGVPGMLPPGFYAQGA
jgi:transcriptional regulator with AAA-type ATPase domain